MPENYDHYISKNIKAFYKRRLAAPIIYLIVLMLAWHFFSLSAVFSPDILPDDTSLETTFRGGKQYISTTLSDLKFTGYTQSIFGHTNGYYYYTMRDEECIIVLLSPNTSEEGLPSIEEVTIKGKISKGNENFDTLLSNLSTDLNWTENGIRNKVSSYYISEPGFNHVGNWILACRGEHREKHVYDREHDAEQCVNSGNENCCKQDPVSNVVKSRFADIVGRNLVADTVFRPV